MHKWQVGYDLHPIILCLNSMHIKKLFENTFKTRYNGHKSGSKSPNKCVLGNYSKFILRSEENPNEQICK